MEGLMFWVAPLAPYPNLFIIDQGIYGGQLSKEIVIDG